MMTGDNEPTPLFGHVASDQCDWHLDIGEVAAGRTEHMVVAIFSPIVSARLIGKRQLLDQPMLRQEMKRAVDSPIRDLRVFAANPLKDLSGGQMPFRRLDFRQDHCPLRRLAERPIPL
jgi:hypothetical protein